MNRPLVTLVVPIYNTERYLDRCVNSLVNQTYKEIEILLIDDGSCDTSPMICDNWAKADSRIRVIHKQNEGLGNTRNVGINQASGSYVCFCDSDDYLDLNTIESVVCAAQNEQAEVVIYGINTVANNGEIKNSFIPHDTIKTFRNEQVLTEFFPEYIAPDPLGDGKRLYYMSPCLILYSMDMLKDSEWSFVSERDIISEDVYSLLSLFKYIKSVTIVSKALYFYCVNETSLSRSYREDRYDQIKHFYLECVKLCERLNYGGEILHRVSKPYLDFVISALKQEFEFNKNSKKRYQSLKNIIDDDVLQNVLHENKSDNVKLTKKIIFYAMRKKWYFLCILILKIKGYYGY